MQRVLIVLVSELRERGVEFVFLRESINTTTPDGELVFHVLGAVAELERGLILERTMVGLEAAMTRGRKDGRQPVMGEGKIALVSKLMRETERRPCPQCARLLASTGDVLPPRGVRWHAAGSKVGVESRIGR